MTTSDDNSSLEMEPLRDESISASGGSRMEHVPPLVHEPEDEEGEGRGGTDCGCGAFDVGGSGGQSSFASRFTQKVQMLLHGRATHWGQIILPSAGSPGLSRN